GCDRRRSMRGNHCHPSANEVSRQRRQPIIMALCPPELDRNVLAFDIAGLRKAATETGHEWFVLLGRCRIEEPDHRHRRLLRTRRDRPCSRAADERDELAPLQLIDLHSVPAANPDAGYRIGMDQSAAIRIRPQPARAAMSSPTLSSLGCRAKLPSPGRTRLDSRHQAWRPCMATRSDMYRQRAADAKNRATQTNNPHVKSAFK